jgi:exodeoxyribonuclease VII small subunit
MTEPNEQPDFESALENLDQIVNNLEDGTLGLDDSLTEFERGMKLLKRCHGLLQNAEQKIEILTGVSRDGEERTKPLDDSPAPPAASDSPASADPTSLF